MEAGGASEVMVGISGAAVHNVRRLELDDRVAHTFAAPAQAGPITVPKAQPVVAAAAPKPAAKAEATLSFATSTPARAVALAAPTTGAILKRPGSWMPLAGNPHWFKFEVGRLEGEATTPVAIQLVTEPFNEGGRFQVFEAGKAPFYWDKPDPERWLGASAVTASGLTMWSGDLPAGGYYVRVESLGGKNCRLGVSGLTVTY